MAIRVVKLERIEKGNDRDVDRLIVFVLGIEGKSPQRSEDLE